MTKQDFELIARVLRHELEHVACGENQRDTVRSVAQGFASELARANPLFDRGRFLKACGVRA